MTSQGSQMITHDTTRWSHDTHIISWSHMTPQDLTWCHIISWISHDTWSGEWRGHIISNGSHMTPQVSHMISHNLTWHHMTSQSHMISHNLMDLTWYHMILHDLTWPHIISNDITWPHNLTWSHMTSHNLTISHDLTWYHMILHDLGMISHDLT